MVTVFWGGWLRPFPNVGWLEIPMNYGLPLVLFIGSGLLCFPMSRRLPYPPHRLFLIVLGLTLVGIGLIFAVPVINHAIIAPFWFLFKVSLGFYAMVWFRGTFPRFRYDQLMNVGWKVMIPIALAAIAINALIGMAKG